MKSVEDCYGSFLLFNNDAESENITNMYHKLFEEELRSAVLHSSIVIICGSGNGMIDTALCRINPKICIYSFEPRDIFFCLLRKNITANDIENVVTINNALGHMNGSLKLDSFQNMRVDHTDMMEIGNGQLVGYNQDIHFVTLDSLNLFACDIILINMNNCEYITICGGLQTIRKFKPIICFRQIKEPTILNMFGIKNDVNDLLKSLEYEFVEMDNNIIIARHVSSMHREEVQTLMNSSDEFISDAEEISV